jgi:signal transduction histidine kinase
LHKAPVNVTTLGTRVCQLVATIARTANVTLTPPAADETLRIAADDGQLTQVLTNLVVNAIQATASGGTVSVQPELVELVPPPYIGGDTQRWMAISVHDTGAGMDEDTRARIFEPFYTTKGIGDGTGLGLSVSWGLVREHGGWIDVQSARGEGSTFTVYVPAGGRA